MDFYWWIIILLAAVLVALVGYKMYKRKTGRGDFYEEGGYDEDDMGEY